MKKMLKLYTSILLIIIFSIAFISCSSSKRIADNKRNYKYFRITADADDDPIFVKLQDDLYIDPKQERYVIIVNIQDNIPEKYILFGDIDDSNSKRFRWEQLSEEVRMGLINWNRSSKESIE